MTSTPSYLQEYSGLFAQEPRAAALQWFREARYGLFLHYGLYSLLERHEWAQLNEKIPVAEYEKLAARFTAHAFDAGAICDLALEAGMTYVNLTTRHHDSFCLWDTAQTDFKSTAGPCGRDLVSELARECGARGLGLFLYYSHGRDWKHPHAPNNDEWGGSARPEYSPPEPSYAYGQAHDLNIYLDFMTAQITELLTNYGPIAGIWLDGIMTPLSGDKTKFKCQELYDHIHALQPQCLVSYKQGLLGTEDFLAPEHQAVFSEGKPGEICTTLCPDSWGYHAAMQGRHKSAEEVVALARETWERGWNLLLNTGLLPDGDLDEEDVQILQRAGAMLRAQGEIAP